MLENISNTLKCRIIVDAMGGDFAPLNVLLGSAEALKENPNLNLKLIGKLDIMNKLIKENNISFNQDVEDLLIDAESVIEMNEHPANAVKTKTDSSIVKGVKLVKEGLGDAFVSAGNTGAVMAASTLYMGRLKGINRPVIGSIIPNLNGITMLFDVGSNVDVKPRNILEWAYMASIFVTEIYNIPNPKIGLLSIGEEKEKGNLLTAESYQLLKDSSLNFVGNVEGSDILTGDVNIVVCDGFIGNIILKFGEAVLTFLKSKFKSYADKSLSNKLKMGIVKGSMRQILGEFDYQTYGGVPLLGLNNISIIGHGKSSPLAIKNMIYRAAEMHEKQVVEKISAISSKFS